MDNPQRRKLLGGALSGVAALAASPASGAASNELWVDNITRLYPVRVGRIAIPRTTADAQRALDGWVGQVSIGGARCSMGGQIAIRDGLHLDMRGMNRLVNLDPVEKRIRVQAGMRWRDLQEIIDPHGLSVRTMQSFANFTVGGSVSVNVHGRYVGHGPIVNSIRALQLVLPDGRVIEASRADNADLFRATLGGYGAMGLVTEIEIDLDDNFRIERQVETLALPEYPAWFAERVLTDPGAVLHNVDVYPPSFKSAAAITWRRTEKDLTTAARLRPIAGRYTGQRSAIWAVSELPGGRKLRERLIEPKRLGRPEVVWRNHEASLDIAELEPFSRFMSTYALEEYFIPGRSFQPFLVELRRILRKHDAEVLNLSIRHSPRDADSLMAWAREDVFSFVLYYKQRMLEESSRRVGNWTRELVAAALDHEGTYYLPYQLHATVAQFRQAFPRADEFAVLKARVDPAGRFSNEMWRKYFGW
jgi:FAD/FMN-containing dehydrogenase